MFCVDPALTMLAKHGYNVVRLPRTGIEPLDVFGRDANGIEALGRLPTIWENAGTVPVPQDGNVAADIKTVKTAALKASIGVRVLEEILTGLGASIPKVDFAYNRKKSLTFSFGNIQIVKVDPFVVGQYLKVGDLQSGNPWVARYFFDDDAEAFIITEVLKSDAVTVSTGSESGASAGVDVKAIEGVVGGSVSVEANNAEKTEVTYKGMPARHLTFGFKAFRISYHNGVWKVAGVDPSKGETYLDAEETAAEGMLLARRGDSVGRVSLSRAGV
jgi:hypothetical protein